MAEHDEEDAEPNDHDDGYIEIAGVNDNVNKNEIARVHENQQPPDDNYYPQAFYDKAADDNKVLGTEDKAINPDHLDEDNIPIVETVEDEEDLHNALECSMDEQYDTHTGTYDLHPWHARDCSHLHAAIAGSECNANRTFEEMVMTQHTMKKGLEIFWEARVEAVLTEMKQLHDHNVMEPKFAD